jgi:hypothetical protein
MKKQFRKGMALETISSAFLVLQLSLKEATMPQSGRSLCGSPF